MASLYAQDIAQIKTDVATLLERSGTTNRQLEKLNGTVDEVEGRVNTNSRDIAKLQERQGILAAINTAITVVGASIAAAIGLQR